MHFTFFMLIRQINIKTLIDKLRTNLALRGQTVHFVHSKRIPQQGRSLCSFIHLNRSDKILTCLGTCLWNPGTYRHKFVRLSRAQFGLVMRLYSKLADEKPLFSLS